MRAGTAKPRLVDNPPHFGVFHLVKWFKACTGVAQRGTHLHLTITHRSHFIEGSGKIGNQFLPDGPYLEAKGTLLCKWPGGK